MAPRCAAATKGYSGRWERGTDVPPPPVGTSSQEGGLHRGPGDTRKAPQRGRRGSTSKGSVRTAPLTQRFLLGVFLTPFLGIGSKQGLRRKHLETVPGPAECIAAGPVPREP